MSFGYLSHAKKEEIKRYTRTCACTHTLRSHCYWHAQVDNCSHKKVKDFQRNESRERQSDLLFVSFFKITGDYLLGNSHSNFESIELRSPFIHSVLQPMSV